MRLITLAFISLFVCSLVFSESQYYVKVKYEANPIYRWYQTKDGDHFFCLDSQGEAAPTSGYKSEGIGFYTLKNQENGSVPFYRLYLPGGGHFYTSDLSEQQGCVRTGWTAEGDIGYVLKSNVLGSIAIHRYFNSDLNRHFYTAHPENELLNGWKDEGVIGYGFDSAESI